MWLTPEQFLEKIAAGVSPWTLNLVAYPKTIEEYRAYPLRKEYGEEARPTLRYLVRYQGHSLAHARDYLNTDYTYGYTVCRNCGSATRPHHGSKKHLSLYCHHCDRRHHQLYATSAAGWRDYSGPYFDTGLTYTASAVQVEQYKALVKRLFPDPVVHPIEQISQWYSSTVRALVCSIAVQWEDRDSDYRSYLPILADALEEAGCTQIELLARLRDYGETEDKWDFWPVKLLLAYERGLREPDTVKVETRHGEIHLFPMRGRGERA